MGIKILQSGIGDGYRGNGDFEDPFHRHVGEMLKVLGKFGKLTSGCKGVAGN